MQTIRGFASYYGYPVEKVLEACEEVGVDKHNGRVLWITLKDAPDVLNYLRHSRGSIETPTIDRTMYLREYRRRRRVQLNEYRRRWLGGTGAGTSRYIEKTRKWADKNPEKMSAYAKLYWSLRRGDIRKLPCAVCGDSIVIAYFTDYSRPLDVEWLCRRHHYERKQQEKRGISNEKGEVRKEG